ncbi:MAG: deoxyguanosinetriphosphate triphosphohydrolase [Proteobacteria bacterium]|nr:deoxyguanosinetriphosphate triphosphohydrolase [Pseudomonadota bacterium]MDA1059335.1 deoxyguanosinetriphosphate triphosphohydrolase [Pseudomonadota bacterium]
MSERIPLAPFACDPAHSRGRCHPEPESAMRTAFQRDRDRVIHSGAFRRLKHKTQVFVYHEGDYYRTRLTHSIEVAQVARTVARALGLNEDLAEALALAHDLGHTPFGHAGEDALDAAMTPYGGFDHNAQTLRVLSDLEHRYAEFDGLNLTWETLEGVVKHNGPLIGPNAAKSEPVDGTILAFNAGFDLGLDTFASGEAQVAALADDIAYNAHDIDDGVRAGLFRLEDLKGVPLGTTAVEDVLSRYPDLEQSRLVNEVTRRVLDAMVVDLLDETRRRLKAANPASADDIRGLDHAVAAFSDGLAEADRALKAFLFDNMYRHARVNEMTAKARGVVTDLFAHFIAHQGALSPEWQPRLAAATDETARARLVADYIAGMTDRYALQEHAKLSA